jgi:hypothetical protein
MPAKPAQQSEDANNPYGYSEMNWAAQLDPAYAAAHMRRAIDYGATKEELFEAIKATAVPGGGVAYSVGVRALQALEQDWAFPRPSPPSPSRSQRGKANPPAARQWGKATTR